MIYGINRLKRRNPPCDAPLCVVSSFFLMGKEEREGAAQGGFLLLGLFIIYTICDMRHMICPAKLISGLVEQLGPNSFYVC